MIHLNDEFFETHSSLQLFVSSALSLHSPKTQASVVKQLASEEITIQHLIGSDISDTRDILSKIGLKGGVLLSLLTAIRESMGTIEHTWIEREVKEGEGSQVKAEHPLLRSDADRTEDHEEDLDGEDVGEKVSGKEKIDVFISYSWSTKDACRQIREICESAHLRCWFDEGEMTGGDDLFAKIDKGIRSAGVVLACISPGTLSPSHSYSVSLFFFSLSLSHFSHPGYIKSKNCLREFSLASDLNKMIIPLIVERVAWPPEGSLGAYIHIHSLRISLTHPSSTQRSSSYRQVVH